MRVLQVTTHMNIGGGGNYVPPPTRTPFVTTCHGFFEKRLGRRLFGFWGDAVIAISDAVKESLVSDFNVAAERITRIYNGVDTAKFSAVYSPRELSDFKRLLGLKIDLPVIGTIGRLSPV